MENSRFEDSFKDAFSGAEVTPTEAVWTNIELSLEKASGGKMKRNLLLFQFLAAASVAFACGVGALYYINGQSGKVESSGQQASVKKDISVPQSTQPVITESLENQERNDSKETVELAPLQKTVNQQKQNAVSYPKEELVAENNDSQNQSAFIERSIARKPLSAYTRVSKPELTLAKRDEPATADPGMVLLAKLKDEEERYRKEDEKKSRENVWASVGLGAGSYRPNREVISSDKTSSSKSGASYTAGINVGGRITRRLIVQGGVSYLSQSADFVSTSASQGAASLNEFVRPSFSNEGNVSGTPVSSYNVNSSLQFVSVPVQAGYVIIDRTFSIQVNGGVATDLFISNTLVPDNNQLQKVTQAAGKDSPYRTVTFSGLLGTEFSYRIADQYRISVNPGLRYSLNSIYKDEIAARITPMTFDVSLRFRYIFK
ncbi:MAG: outer membrane beta-barrel protein [Cyclobacteriaceae bacterium]|nr:outer membrane beta-barrel protein [Cyclobacteriaceae bacterium]